MDVGTCPGHHNPEQTDLTKVLGLSVISRLSMAGRKTTCLGNGNCGHIASQMGLKEVGINVSDTMNEI